MIRLGHRGSKPNPPTSRALAYREGSLWWGWASFSHYITVTKGTGRKAGLYPTAYGARMAARDLIRRAVADLQARERQEQLEWNAWLLKETTK